MEQKKSSYSEEELNIFRKNEPTHDRWGMQYGDETIYIPIKKIKLDHLQNIIIWIKEHELHYSPRILEKMENELKRRLTKSKAGKVLYGSKQAR